MRAISLPWGQKLILGAEIRYRVCGPPKAQCINRYPVYLWCENFMEMGTVRKNIMSKKS